MAIKKKKGKYGVEVVKDDSLKGIMAKLKFITVVAIILCCVLCAGIITCAVLTGISVATSNTTELVNNESVIKYLTMISDTSTSEIKELIAMGIDSSFLIFNLALPSLFCIIICIFIAGINKEIYVLLKPIKTNKQLFTSENCKKLNKIREYLAFAGFLIVINFNLLYIFAYIVLECMLEIIIYLFKYCVNKK